VQRCNRNRTTAQLHSRRMTPDRSLVLLPPVGTIVAQDSGQCSSAPILRRVGPAHSCQHIIPAAASVPLLPPMSLSVPVTRSASMAASPRLNSKSCPGSPRVLPNKQNAPGLLAPMHPELQSPARATRRHEYHVLFGTDPRTWAAYHPILPKTPTTIAFDGTSTLEPLGAIKVRNVCSVHAYMDPSSTLSNVGGCFGKEHVSRGGPATRGPPVHAYAPMASTLKTTGTAVFGRETRLPPLTSGPIRHAYGPLPSTLTKSGGSTFGTPHMSPRRCAHVRQNMSRTGLCVTTSKTRS